MTRFLIVYLAASSLSIAAAPAGPAGPSESNSPTALPADCDGRWYGVSDKGELAAFAAQLRRALVEADPVQLAVLARFPLQVNGPGSESIAVGDPQTLQLRYDQYAPKELRGKVLAEPGMDVWCSYRGIGFGGGHLWAQPVVLNNVLSYRLTVINLPDSLAPNPLKERRVIDFICETPKHRVVVDSIGNSRFRYRAWNKPRPITDKPDLELAGTDDTYTSEGTGPCRYSIWTFSSGTTEFSVSELGCTEGPPPEGSVGRLSVQKDGRPLGDYWCQ